MADVVPARHPQAADSLHECLEGLYRQWNRRRFVHPDPLESLYRYIDPLDQEIVGLLAAGLAYGRVTQILASIERVLSILGAAPRTFLERTSASTLARSLAGFRHRFTSGAELASLLAALKRAVVRHGSLEALFASGLATGDATVLPALSRLVDELRRLAPAPCPTLLSSPDDGSACKRLNLWLRWMIRRDAVDPGPWRAVAGRARARLVVPLDTHLFQVGRALGLTARRQADLRAALEITLGFAAIAPRDPVRYDFCLTRLGIRPECRDLPLPPLLAPAAPATRRFARSP